MAARVHHVLFLCTGNSARSVLAESLLNALGGGRFQGHSAGSHPTGRIHPMTLRCLEGHGHPTDGLASKGFEAFEGLGAPELDFVITVCDAARGQACPVWPGHPTTAHWGVEDPAAFEGGEAGALAIFEETYDVLAHRVRRLVALPIVELDDDALRRELVAIGSEHPEQGPPRG